MLQSHLFTKTLRNAPRDEESRNAQLLIRAGYVSKLMAGVYTILPLGLRVVRNIERIIREEVSALGGQEIVMPALQPKANWMETGRWDVYDTLFRFTSYATKTEYALGPTHEEIISPLMKSFIFSFKDLPRAVFQIQNKFRDEKRAKSGLLRGREFMMKDLYSFHADEADLDRFYEQATEKYRRIFDRTGIGKVTYVTFASGGTFSKYSHEFQALTDAGEDIIYVCEPCHTAINREIIEDQKTCPSCGSKKLAERKAIEVGNIFKLKTKYSEPFGLLYQDSSGQRTPVIMGCYGIGIQRLMGAIVEVCADDTGIVWPESVAPYRFHVVPLYGSKEEKNKKVQKAVERIEKILKEHHEEALVDDRIDMGAGEKFADADLMGIPYRLVVSERTLEKDSIEMKKRTALKAELVTMDKFEPYVAKAFR